MAKVTVAFTVDTEKDKRILRWLNSLPRGEKSRAIREALNAHLGKGGITLGHVYEAIQDLKRSGLVVTQTSTSGPQSDIPPDVLERLDKLGL